ncbi:hypothetical protein GCM10023201_44960 [Actinomycetospora corticicola]|uniref:PPE family protein n=1 Tax=Actinomycetospora corticicola TaxID=663602 RepID=A0A7Y9E0Z7_9PSEU|nr:hypothetical protein [Actinomycetospora corticicola]NYD39153.1 hypothetical protein [Actinomycetospora corticicola]
MFDVNWETRSHADIHAQLQGRGGGFTDAGGAWNSLATRLRDVAGSVERATSGIAATRTGPAAQAAGGAVGPMGPWADEARTFSDAVGSASHEQNRALTATRGAVSPPVPRPPVTLQTWEGVGALAALDVDSAENSSLDAERRARAAMGRYQEFSSLRASGLPQFSSPGQGAPQVQLVSGPPGGGVTVPPGPGSPGVGGGGSTRPGPGSPGAGGGGSAPSGPGPGSAVPGGSASPAPAAPGVVPPSGAGGPSASPVPGAPGVVPTPGPGSASASPRPGSPGAVPTPGTPGSAGPGVGAPASPRPGVPGGALGSLTPGAQGGVPVSRPGLPGGAPTAGAAGPSGTGASASSRPGPTTTEPIFGPGGSGGTAGTGTSTGALRPGLPEPVTSRSPVEPLRTGSVLEPAVPPRNAAATGMPFAPIGGVGGAGTTEQRLSLASYLVEDDPDALAGELPRVAPPVIGG